MTCLFGAKARLTVRAEAKRSNKKYLSLQEHSAAASYACVSLRKINAVNVHKDTRCLPVT